VVDEPENTPCYQPLAPIVQQCLTSFGYPYESHRDGTDLRFLSRTAGGGKWRSRFVVYEDGRLLQFQAFLTDCPYPVAKSSWVNELAGRASEEILLGSIGIQWDSGAVFHRRDADFREREVTEEEIARLLNASAVVFALWETAYRFLDASDNVSPELAVATAKVLVGLEGAPAAAGMGTALLRVVQGGGAGSGHPSQAAHKLGLVH
jgi:hypothetical protein